MQHDHDEVRAAVREASVPVLLMCLAQLTGDERWTCDPFLPRRDTSLFADESGGLDDDVQDVVREAMFELLTADPSTDAAPSLGPVALGDDERTVQMMRVFLGEEIPPEYVPMALDEMGLRDRTVRWHGEPPAERLSTFRVLVVGAGVSGIAAAATLQRMGIAFDIVERAHDLGGTWAANDYPEAGVDTPNHFYSFSFAPNLGWSRHYSKRSEVHDYVAEVADHLQLREHVRFGTEVTSMEWHDDLQRWTVSLCDVDRPDAPLAVGDYDVVVTAVGQLNRPKASTIPGIDDFAGESWHSSQWRSDVPLEGLDVAVVGTGASAMQFLRSVAETAKAVTVFQRSPQWARPLPDYHADVTAGTAWLLRHVPGYYEWYRFGLLWRYGDGLLPSLRRAPEWSEPQRSVSRRNDRHRIELTNYVLEQLDGRDDLIATCLPDYPPYGKRMLIDNGWYAALRRPNVHLVAEGVDHVDGDEIVTSSGARHAADVIVLATGFEAGKLLAPMHVVGRNGTVLRDVWGDDDPHAYLGISVPDFPNLFCLYGPTTNVAHGGSVIFMAECQVRHISLCLRDMLEQGIGAVAVRADVEADYNARTDAEHAELVWTHPGMRNWYRNDRGRVFSPTPYRLVDYWRMTHDADLTAYVCDPVVQSSEGADGD